MAWFILCIFYLNAHGCSDLGQFADQKVLFLTKKNKWLATSLTTIQNAKNQSNVMQELYENCLDIKKQIRSSKFPQAIKSVIVADCITLSMQYEQLKLHQKLTTTILQKIQTIRFLRKITQYERKLRKQAIMKALDAYLIPDLKGIICSYESNQLEVVE